MPPDPSSSPPIVLRFDGITKSFFGVKVLKGVTFEVADGSTVGLVGENGAGKSTLMNVLGGNLRPDSGKLTFNGQPYSPARSRDAADAGIAFIHQELNLFPNLSIAENLFLTSFPTRAGLIQQGAIRSRSLALTREVGLDLDPGTLVERLSAGERQLVEIARALSIEPRLILLDEPTSSLTNREIEHLFALLARLRQRGIAMIYISHALNDVLRLSDEIVVLRDGEVVGNGPARGFTEARMISLMVGREMEQLYPDRTATPGERTVLEVKGVSQPGMVRDISFNLAEGEILGVAGLMGSGRTELARILFGLDPAEQGSIRLHDREITALSPRERIRQGLAFLTENRRDEGLCQEASIADNLSLASIARHAAAPFGWLDRTGIATAVARIRDAVRLTPSARDQQPVKTLSGGNQQKVVLAKWLLNEPTAFILDEPTRGIDVGARFEVYTLIHQLAGHGTGILILSSEIEELTGLCDRILVLGKGEIRAEFSRPGFDRERILRAAYSFPDEGAG